jgi:SAM-dependent methyltransferase
VGAGLSCEAVIWHDLECGGYAADIPYWLRLAHRHGGPVLDVGAGTGRVALALARAGHAVVALERDAELADELERRCAGLPVDVRRGDACAFALPQVLPLCIVPMQTVHLLADRVAFLHCARAALRPRGVLAVALLGAGVEPFELELEPDDVQLDSVRYESAPTALRRAPAGAARRDAVLVIERRRSRFSAGAPPRVEVDLVTLRECDPDTLAREAAEAGFALGGVDAIAPTREHVGSAVVRLEARP